MSVINVLDFSVANLIAAGEVVDRPASAVKELLENSLDAGSKHITVEIKNGGTTLIKVSDDGCGMGKDDLPVSIKRHATSKIKNASDLDEIMTLGFRGEALAALAAVCKLQIISKTADESCGYKLTSEYGRNVTVEETGCHNGTTVIAEDLFANTPARRKFLKRDATEAMAVGAVVEKIALSRPDVAIVFISDNSIKTDTAGDGRLDSAIYAVLGKDFFKKTIPVSYTSEGISVEGYIGSPENVRGNRNYQNFFLNGRYVKSNAMSSALEEAFFSYMPKERFPCCVINVTIPASLVDVNVHPTKLEVKFSNDRMVFNAVYTAVRSAVTTASGRPEMIFRSKVPDYTNAFTPIVEKEDRDADRAEKRTLFDNRPATDYNIEPEKTSNEDLMGFLRSDKVSSIEKSEENNDRVIYSSSSFTAREVVKEEKEVKPAPEKREIPPFRYIGCAFDAYIFMETGEKVYIIDKHAAHERIIFEQMRENMAGAANYSQILLIPYEFAVNGLEAEALKESEADIKKTGVDFEIKGGKAVIKAVPHLLDLDTTVNILQSLANEKDNMKAEVSATEAFEKRLFQASCKAAMKAGIKDTDENMRWLCSELLRLDCVRYCPHGRPVAFELGKKEIERQFLRG